MASANMTPSNGVMMQYFHWYIDADGTLWQKLEQRAADLAAAGITALWLPPAYKGSSGGYDVGYGVYDMYDLGEFEQKGSTRTKYGTKAEYLAAIRSAKQAGLQVYADIVLNHRDGGDETEKVQAVPVAWDNRNHELGDAREIEIYTLFNFPGRNDRYSSFKWNIDHFDAVNHNAYDGRDRHIYRLSDKQFQTDVDRERRSSQAPP